MRYSPIKTIAILMSGVTTMRMVSSMPDVMEEIIAENKNGILLDDLLRKSKDGDHDKFQHYFRKAHIDANLMTGKPMTALCGRIVKEQVDPKGRTICPVCKQIINEAFGDEK